MLAPTRRRDPDAGSAVVEFVLVTAVLFALVIGIAQVGLAIHVRNTLAACAAEGARLAANADAIPADGVRRTQELAAASLAPGLVDSVQARVVVDGGVPLVEVQVHATLPLVGLAGPARGLRVVAHAVAEPT